MGIDCDFHDFVKEKSSTEVNFRQLVTYTIS